MKTVTIFQPLKLDFSVLGVVIEKTFKIERNIRRKYRFAGPFLNVVPILEHAIMILSDQSVNILMRF
jgi:hypothetical protein